MRAAAFLVVGLALIAVGGGAALWNSVHGDADEDAGAPADAPRSGTPAPAAAKKPRTATARAARPVVAPDQDLLDAWNAALALHKAGKSVDALVALAPLRKRSPEWFLEPARAKLVADVERAALAALSRAVRSSDPAEAQRIAALLRDALLLAGNADKIDALLAAAARREGADDIAVGADILARVKDPKEKAALASHLWRFAKRGAAPKNPDWVDAQLTAVERANAALAEPVPLALPDAEEAERRRLDQLEKLRQRGAIGLLGAIDGALAWLALHQAEDGRFAAEATVARCKALGHATTCVDAASKERYPVAATGLAVLAFLDFRDQDVRRLFEPTLARGVAWLRSQQQADGSFAGTGRSGYSAGIGLMALGQAAAAAGDDDLRLAVERGLAFYDRQQGPMGGFRYGLAQPGDLSVTGWYVQAVEAARNAHAQVPPNLTTQLRYFLSFVTQGDHSEKFSYLVNESPRVSLAPIGMLSTAILDEESVKTHGDFWRNYLHQAPPERGGMYTLYYGVRMLLLLDGKLPEKWNKQLAKLAGTQTAKGSAAGMFPADKDPWFSRFGPTTATAFAALTLEHALYRR